MLEKKKRFVWSIVVIAVATSGAIAIVREHGRTAPGNRHDLPTISGMNTAPQEGRQAAGRLTPRNLSLQPEAFKLSRKLGQRFKAAGGDVSTLAGTLTTGGERHSIQIVRRQDERGERIEIATDGAAALTWSETDGARNSTGTAQDAERKLIERLVLDSPDQFILAQLRGASYYTVAHNVRPTEAGDSDGYNGPLWDIVRMEDPESDEQKRPMSRWRLYYLNTATGLIDKVVSELDGEQIEANFSAWTEHGGEKFPSRITWTRQGQEIMAFTLTDASHSRQQ